MDATGIAGLIAAQAYNVGEVALAILATTLAVPVSLFVFRWGWGEVKRALTDESYTIGGFFVRKVPYAGYNRWRSRKWNMEHTAS